MLSIIFASLITATTPSAPIQVATCHVSTPALMPQTGDKGGYKQVGDYKLHVRFTNLSTEPISSVVFRLNNGSSVTDVGTFSPNVTIDHWMNLHRSAATATGCAVSSVQLAPQK